MLVISSICKLFGHNFWWNCLEFSDKIGLAIPIKVFNNAKCRDEIYLKFGEIFFTSITMLGIELKAGISSAIKESISLYCHKFSGFVITANSTWGLSYKETWLLTDILNFVVETLVFQNRSLNSVYFILDIEIP